MLCVLLNHHLQTITQIRHMDMTCMPFTIQLGAIHAMTFRRRTMSIRIRRVMIRRRHAVNEDIHSEGYGEGGGDWRGFQGSWTKSMKSCFEKSFIASKMRVCTREVYWFHHFYCLLFNCLCIWINDVLRVCVCRKSHQYFRLFIRFWASMFKLSNFFCYPHFIRKSICIYSPHIFIDDPVYNSSITNAFRAIMLRVGCILLLVRIII